MSPSLDDPTLRKGAWILDQTVEQLLGYKH
jgi:hypothetical protein